MSYLVPKTNIPEDQWWEDDIFFWDGLFSGGISRCQLLELMASSFSKLASCPKTRPAKIQGFFSP